MHQQHAIQRCITRSGPFVAEVPIDGEKSRSAAPGGAELPLAEPHLGHPCDGRGQVTEKVQWRMESWMTQVRNSVGAKHGLRQSS